MFHLVQAFLGKGKLAFGGGLGFFDEAMQDHDTLADLGAKKSPAYAFRPLRPNLEQSATQSFCVRHPKVGAKFPHAPGYLEKVGANAHRPSQYIGFDLGSLEFEGIAHGLNITRMLSQDKATWFQSGNVGLHYTHD
jgi:hypothetical protein